MDLDWETFLGAYKKAPVETKQLIDSDTIGDCVQAQIDIGTIDTDHQSTFLLTLSHLTLGTISTEQAIEHLNTLGAEKAETIVATLQSCISDTNSEPTPTEPVKKDQTEEASYTSSQEALLREGKKPNSEPTPPSETDWQVTS